MKFVLGIFCSIQKLRFKEICFCLWFKIIKKVSIVQLTLFHFPQYNNNFPWGQLNINLWKTMDMIFFFDRLRIECHYFET